MPLCIVPMHQDAFHKGNALHLYLNRLNLNEALSINLTK